jgi:hypothetical protein
MTNETQTVQAATATVHASGHVIAQVLGGGIIIRTVTKGTVIDQVDGAKGLLKWLVNQNAFLRNAPGTFRGIPNNRYVNADGTVAV